MRVVLTLSYTYHHCVRIFTKPILLLCFVDIQLSLTPISLCPVCGMSPVAKHCIAFSQ